MDRFTCQPTVLSLVYERNPGDCNARMVINIISLVESTTEKNPNEKAMITYHATDYSPSRDLFEIDTQNKRSHRRIGNKK